MLGLGANQTDLISIASQVYIVALNKSWNIYSNENASEIIICHEQLCLYRLQCVTDKCSTHKFCNANQQLFPTARFPIFVGHYQWQHGTTRHAHPERNFSDDIR